ncbi:MAG: hypothetical protein R6W88_12450 [Desulfobacterales bacterium]
MEPTNNDKKSDTDLKINENSSSDIEALLNRLRKTGVTELLTMNKKAQTTLSYWAHDLVKQYSTVLKNNPMKLKDITKLPSSKLDVKLAIKLLILASVKKGPEDSTVVNLRDKFVSLGSFQSVDQEEILRLMKHNRTVHKKSMGVDMSSLPGLNKYMDLIISEQKVLIEEVNSFIEDIRKIKKNFVTV